MWQKYAPVCVRAGAGPQYPTECKRAGFGGRFRRGVVGLLLWDCSTCRLAQELGVVASQVRLGHGIHQHSLERQLEEALLGLETAKQHTQRPRISANGVKQGFSTHQCTKELGLGVGIEGNMGNYPAGLQVPWGA